jgi:Tol biopolymer transport system component
MKRCPSTERGCPRSTDSHPIRSDGTGLVQMTHEPGKEVIAPVWTPDSRRLYFSDVRGEADIWLLKLEQQSAHP